MNFEVLEEENELGLKVVAIGPEFSPKAKTVAKRSGAGSVVDKLDCLLDNPLATGMSFGQRLRDPGPPSASHVGPLADEAADAIGYACKAMDEMLDRVPNGFADDVCEDLAEACGLCHADDEVGPGAHRRGGDGQGR